MITQKFQNPILALAPFLAVCLTYSFANSDYSLLFGALVAFGIIMKNFFYKTYTYQLIIFYDFFVLLGLFLLTNFGVRFNSFDVQTKVLILRVAIITAVLLLYLIVGVASTLFFRKRHNRQSLTALCYKQFKRTAFWLIADLSVVAIYAAISRQNPAREDGILLQIEIVEFLLLLVLITIGWIRARKFVSLFEREEFLPIVNDSGAITGKVARSASKQNDGLHPFVRVHLLGEDESLYLFRKAGKELWDCAIDEAVLYGETIEQTIEKHASARYVLKDFQPKFLLKYRNKTADESQLILLYFNLRINNIQINDSFKGDFKRWYPNQIQDNLGKQVFSELFEKEYELLKNTVLLADRFSKTGDGR